MHDTFWSGDVANFRISNLASSNKLGFLATIETFPPNFTTSMAKYLPIPLEPPVI